MAIGKTNVFSGGTGAALTVNAPVGATVSVSKDGKTKTKTANADGLAVFKGLATGTWTLTITDGVQTSTKTVVITADYNAVIAFFSATINITYPAGSTCTCSDGTTTLAAPDTSGTWPCIVPNAGTWTVTCTDGSKSKSVDVSITADGQSKSVALSYELYLYDNGIFADGVGELTQVGVPYAGGSAGSCVIQLDESFVSIETDAGTSALVYFPKKYDLSGFDTLYFNGSFVKNSELDGSFGFGAWKTIPTTDASVAASALLEGFRSQGTHPLNVSDVTGEHYIGIVVWGYGGKYACKATMKQMYLK